MCSKKLHRLRKDFALSLALRYTAIFALALTLVLFAIYVRISNGVIQAADKNLKEDIREFRAMRSSMDLKGLEHQLQFEAKERGESSAVFRLLSPKGKLLAGTDESHWKELEINPDYLDRAMGGTEPVIISVPRVGDRNYVRVAYVNLGDGIGLQLASSLRTEYIAIRQYKILIILGGILVTLLSGIVAYKMARSAIRRVEGITSIADRIATSGKLQERVPLNGKVDEIHQLAIAFNRMLERIDHLVLGSRHLIDHIAHELRSPITRARGAAEAGLTSSNSEIQHLAQNSIEELDKLSSIISTLLSISEAESGASARDTEAVDLNKLLEMAVELFQPVAEQAGIEISFVSSSTLRVYGKREKLELVFSNIIDNALKYSSYGKYMTVSTQVFENKVQVLIEDDGRGISEEALPHVFERFYRSKESAKHVAGHGLGLSLAKAIVELYGGTISIDSKLGSGTRVIITLSEVR